MWNELAKTIRYRQFEIWIDLTNKENEFVVLIVLSEAQNYKNNKLFFPYFELLLKNGSSSLKINQG